MKRLIHISDPHIVVPPAKVSGQLETATLLMQAVDRIAEAMNKLGPVSALLVTGDITDSGDDESYDLFKQIVEPLGLPMLTIPGNHDRREPMRQAFAESGMPEAGALNWTRDLAGLRVIGLDTLVEGKGGGSLEGTTLDYLEDALLSAPQGPVLVALHHPPFVTGIHFMDQIGLDNSDALSAIIRHSKRDVRIVCGHIHSMQIASVGGAITMSAPAICSTFDLDFRTDAPVGFFDRPGGFMLHDWESGFRSIVVPLNAGNGPSAFG